MNIDTAKASAEAEIRELLERWRQAVLAKDIDGIVAPYAPDIVAFDAILALQFKGKEAYRKHWQACFEMCPAGAGPMAFDFHEFQISASNDVAFGHGLVNCGGPGPDGAMQSHWMRVTIGYRKSGGSWQVVHEHFSAPFDIETMKALELQP